MIEVSCEQIVETELPIGREFKDSFFWQQNDGSQGKLSKKDFMQIVCMHEKSHYRRGGLMVQVGISIDGRTDPHIIQNDNLTAQSMLRTHSDDAFSEIKAFAYCPGCGDCTP
ncbi:hypothetical protein TNCV_2702531 [Trichonephila clavipes]|nr:hypothetical protein TNCV_2702531 [Trichonephila clavipes]